MKEGSMKEREWGVPEIAPKVVFDLSNSKVTCEDAQSINTEHRLVLYSKS